MVEQPEYNLLHRRHVETEYPGICRELGTGLAVLPRPLGDTTAGLERVELGEAPPARDTWLGYHRDLRRLRRLRALVELVVERLAG